MNENQMNIPEQPQKKKKSTVGRILMIILDIAILLIVAHFIIGYINFDRISKNEKTIMINNVDNYTTDEGNNVTVYEGGIYKIVKIEIPGNNITYKLKLWFMDNLN